MRRWGPIIAIVVVAAIVAALVVMGGGDDDEASDGGDGSTDGTAEEATDVTTEDGDPIYPFSWSDGEAAGLTDEVGSSRVDLQACKLEYSIVSPK